MQVVPIALLKFKVEVDVSRGGSHVLMTCNVDK